MKDLFARLQQDLDQRDRMAGMTPADLLELPDVERRIVQLLVRRGDLAPEDVAHELGLDTPELEAAVAALEEKAFVRRTTFRGRQLLRTHFARSRRSGAGLDLWAKLANRVESEKGGRP